MNIGEHAGQPTSALTATDDWLHIFSSHKEELALGEATLSLATHVSSESGRQPSLSKPDPAAVPRHVPLPESSCDDP